MAKSNWILLDFDKNFHSICEAMSLEQRERREVRPGQPCVCFEEGPSSHWWKMVLLALMMPPLPLSKFCLAAVWTEVLFLSIRTTSVCLRSRDSVSQVYARFTFPQFLLSSVLQEVVEFASRTQDNCNNRLQ